jgi:hypothetical protein
MALTLVSSPYDLQLGMASGVPLTDRLYAKTPSGHFGGIIANYAVWLGAFGILSYR